MGKNFFIFLSVILIFYGCRYDLLLKADYFPEREDLMTYKEILDEGITPGIATNYNFPNSYQYRNGCFAFAVNHVLEYKYDEGLDLYEVEETIEKPREELWTIDYILAFLEEYEIEMDWYNDAETFFSFLEQGEPIVIQYKYYLSDEKWIGHIVAAYSFDEEGVWVSESISGTRMRIGYEEIFDQRGIYTQFGFATVKSE